MKNKFRPSILAVLALFLTVNLLTIRASANTNFLPVTEAPAEDAIKETIKNKI